MSDHFGISKQFPFDGSYGGVSSTSFFLHLLVIIYFDLESSLIALFADRMVPQIITEMVSLNDCEIL